VTSGSVVTLTATVTAGGSPVAPGQIDFCDATAKYCTDIHLLGTAQLTSAGTATLKLRPGVGSHSYKAVFVGTTASAASASTASALAVTGLYLTISTIAASGNPGDYTLTATVSGNGSASPTGTVSFLDTSNSNQSLAVVPLTPVAAGLNLLSTVPTVFAGEPENFVVGDFNGDGIADLASAEGDISVSLGAGDGTFTPGIGTPANISVGLLASMTAGDFNGDGKLDLAVASSIYNESDPAASTGSVTVFSGDGGGGFAQVSTNPISGAVNGEAPFAIVTGDFNGDGNLDLAVVNSSSNTVTILLGHGDGTFIAAASPATGNSPSAIAVGDFNGDGKLDLAVTNSASNTVTILLGNGDGTFTSAASPATDKNPVSVAVGDFNGDGILDLAVANRTGNDVTILLGKGDGTFTAGSSPAFTEADTIAVGDFNGDGIADLAVGGSVTAILLGNGDGTFSAPVATLNSLFGDQWLIAADFNGDGRTDLAYLTPNEDDGYVTIEFSELQSATATANNVSVSPAGLNLPTHLIEASYPGDAAYNGSISATAGLTGQAPFTLSGATNTQMSILPGASSSTTVTVTSAGGFSGTVALSCSVVSFGPIVTTNLPTCSIAPSVVISGSATATPTLTITTQAQTSTTSGYMVTVTGTEGGVTESITYQRVIVPYGVFTMTSTPVTVEAGSTGNSTITITPSAAFTGTVALQCSFTFMGFETSPCSIPASVAISGTTTPVTVSLAIPTSVGLDPGNYVVTVMGTASNGTTTGAAVSVTVPVTVTAGPNFTLSSTPVTIAPGGTGTSTLTVTPTLGYTGSVTLTCAPAFEEPDQPNCTSPAPVTISGTAAGTTAITVTTDAATPPGTYMVEVDTQSFPGHVKSAEIAVTVAGPALVPTYTLTNTAVNIASPGATGTSTITITPSGGFTGNVTLACTVTGPAAAIDPPTCAVPAQETVTGTGPVTAMLTVYTTGVTMSAPIGYVAKAEKPLKRIFALGGGAVMSVLFFFGIPGRRRRWKTFLSLLILALIGGAFIGCSGKGNMPLANPGTTLGTYTITVTATSGAIVQSTSVTVGVN
jgi:hypothetical protein